MTDDLHVVYLAFNAMFSADSIKIMIETWYRCQSAMGRLHPLHTKSELKRTVVRAVMSTFPGKDGEFFRRGTARLEHFMRHHPRLKDSGRDIMEQVTDAWHVLHVAHVHA